MMPGLAPRPALAAQPHTHPRAPPTPRFPRARPARAAFLRQIKGRRFIAGLKYWCVLTAVMVTILVIQYKVPQASRYAPNFAYSAAAVGMSDRVESTVFKVGPLLVGGWGESFDSAQGGARAWLSGGWERGVSSDSAQGGWRSWGLLSGGLNQSLFGG